MLRTATTQGASVRNGMADIIVCKKLVQTPYLYPLFPPPADNVFEHDTQKSNVDLCCQTRFRRDILDSRKCCIGKIKRGNCTICDHLHWLYDMSRVTLCLSGALLYVVWICHQKRPNVRQTGSCQLSIILSFKLALDFKTNISYNHWIRRRLKNQLKSQYCGYQKKPLLCDFGCFENFSWRYPHL